MDRADLYEALTTGDSRTIQDNGRVTLPQSWRERFDLTKGDQVVVVEDESGNLEILPPQ